MIPIGYAPRRCQHPTTAHVGYPLWHGCPLLFSGGPLFEGQLVGRIVKGFHGRGGHIGLSQRVRRSGDTRQQLREGLGPKHCWSGCRTETKYHALRHQTTMGRAQPLRAVQRRWTIKIGANPTPARAKAGGAGLTGEVAAALMATVLDRGRACLGVLHPPLLPPTPPGPHPRDPLPGAVAPKDPQPHHPSHHRGMPTPRKLAPTLTENPATSLLKDSHPMCTHPA